MSQHPLPTESNMAEEALQDFFRHELPNPWPACPVPASPASRSATVEQPTVRGLRRASEQGRQLALAASVAIVFVLGISLAAFKSAAPMANQPSDIAKTPDILDTATADGGTLLEQMDPDSTDPE